LTPGKKSDYCEYGFLCVKLGLKILFKLNDVWLRMIVCEFDLENININYFGNKTKKTWSNNS